MELFSEIYSAYYQAVMKILSHKNISKKQIVKIIKENAFSESDFFIMPKLLSDDLWRFLIKKNDEFVSVLKNSPYMPVTLLEKSWIKAVINDEKAGLFLDASEIEKINDKLSDVKPLYKNQYYHYFDMDSDGDNFKDEKYIKHFRQIFEAIKKRRIIEITFNSRKGIRITHFFLPFRIEFSAKNNKFRVFVAQIKNNRTVRISVINIARITDIKSTENIYPEEADMTRIFRYKRCNEPVKLKVFPERNGVERFMMEFAGYEKHTELDEKTGICTALIYFDSYDETELLIKLLSFGPVIKVEAPQNFLFKFRERVLKQSEFNKNKL